jgi:hypothetical protein
MKNDLDCLNITRRDTDEKNAMHQRGMSHEKAKNTRWRRIQQQKKQADKRQKKRIGNKKRLACVVYLSCHTG